MSDFTVEVNGRPMLLLPGSTVADLVRHLELDESGVAVAVNHAVVPRSMRKGMKLNPMDRVELIHAVGGG